MRSASDIIDQILYKVEFIRRARGLHPTLSLDAITLSEYVTLLDSYATIINVNEWMVKNMGEGKEKPKIYKDEQTGRYVVPNMTDWRVIGYREKKGKPPPHVAEDKDVKK